jgi:hypothetical protein
LDGSATNTTIDGLGIIGNPIQYYDVANVTFHSISMMTHFQLISSLSAWNILMHTTNTHIVIGSSQSNGTDYITSMVYLHPYNDSQVDVCFGALLVNHKSGTPTNQALLTNSSVNNLGPRHGYILYENMCSIDILLTSFEDHLHIDTTHNGNTTVHAGAGDDAITVSPSNQLGTLWLDGGDGSDTYSIYFSHGVDTLLYVNDSSTLAEDKDLLTLHVAPYPHTGLIRTDHWLLIKIGNTTD